MILSGRAPNMARQDNCLPLVYHNVTVHIVNAFCPLGLDSGYQKLYFLNNTVGLDVHVGNAPEKQCYWYIGRPSNHRVGSWVIKNAELGSCIQMGNGGKANARHVYSYPVSDHVDANWLMVPLSFN
ncbi:unnamed protein product [Clonostachys chloroleuca]|uniref:Uncharacterized protein n=1 Tax=Clonostachys chloroleuca TaxID=1926264 RepID=A0AA35VPL5_9HYPO|nr:unnamed protein product [Clonostachys chloroleuca]